MNKDTNMKTDSYRRPCQTKIVCSERSYYRGTPIDGNVLDKLVYEPWNTTFNLKNKSRTFTYEFKTLFMCFVVL